MFSLEQHYHEHSEQIYQFIYFLTFDRALAGDLTQETFIKAHAAQHTYRGDANYSYSLLDKAELFIRQLIYYLS